MTKIYRHNEAGRLGEVPENRCAELTSNIELCRGCGDAIQKKAVIKGLCLNCAKDTYEDKDDIN